MIRRPSGRGISLAAASSLIAAMLLGSAPALGAQANWHFYNPTTGAKDAGELLPPSVVPGHAAGYSFVISNDGPSNISQLFLTDSRFTDDPLNAVPVYFDAGDRTGLCQTDPFLYCAFGPLNAFTHFTVTIAYQTLNDGSTTFPVTFQLNSTGNTFSDNKNKPGTSHGDTLSLTLTTTLSAGKNFDGGFSIDGAPIANSDVLGPKNIQFSSLTPPVLDIGVSLEDGLKDTAYSCAGVAQCANRFGEWTRLFVNDGAHFANGIKVVTTILGTKTPTLATVDNIVLIHVSDDGTVKVIGDDPGETCLGHSLNPDGPDADSLGEECIIVTEVGHNFQVEAWLLSNGGTRLGY